MGFGIHKKEVWDFGISCGWDVGYVSMSQEMIYTMKVVGGFLYVLVRDFEILTPTLYPPLYRISAMRPALLLLHLLLRVVPPLTPPPHPMPRPLLIRS